MSYKYSSFNDLLKETVKRIDKSQQEASPERGKFKKQMRELFNDKTMFDNTKTTTRG